MTLSLSPGMMIDQNYQLIEKIGEGGMSTVFRAMDLTQGREVALKFLKEGVTSSFIEDVIRFKQEVTIISRLSDPGIIKLYGAGEYKGVPYLITELLQGKNLSDYMLEQGALPLKVCLDIMKQLVASLNTMHLNGIIHRDLKPDNIMVQKQDDRVVCKILDFGLSLLVEFDQIKSEQEVAGTFGYMSPEGTGILKRKVDERSDLYSLGITFYQLLTGEIPFKSREVSKLIHEQIAAIPTPPRNIKSDIPPVLERVVLKLIQKDPELRYQSAKGLLYDVQRFLQNPGDFVIGEKDQKIKLSYQTGLLGREEEIEKLRTLFKDVKKGEGRVCVLEGETGIGKNKLVEEVKKWAYEEHFLVMEGRCLDHSNMSPFYPFKEALHQYLKRIDRLGTREKEEQIKKLKESLGNSQDVALRLHPGFAALFGTVTQAAVPLEGDAENQRVLSVLTDLFLSFCNEPVLLFLDDLQWADAATLQLFEELASKIKNSKLFLIGATAPAAENVHRSMTNLKELDTPFSLMALRPLSSQCLNKLIAQILGDKEEKCLELTSYIFEKSQGNPFFSTTILREFVEEKALTWSENGWVADWEKIKKIQVPGNFVHWIIEKIKGLSKDAQELLSLCALIGQEVDLNFLLFTTTLNRAEVLAILDLAVNIQIISSPSRGKMVFSHEKVRDYFLEKMPRDKKAGHHYKIAQTLEIFHQNSESIFSIIKNFSEDKKSYYLKMASSMTEDKKKLEPQFFKLAYHYEQSGDKDRTLEYAALAAQKARKEYANDLAFHFYSVTIQILEEKGQKTSRECFAAKEELAEICLITGKYEKAKALLQEILVHKGNSFEKLKIYRKVIATHLKKGDLDFAESYLLEGLVLLGDRIPSRAMIGFATLKECFVHRLHRLMPKNFLFKAGKTPHPADGERALFYLHLHQIYTLKDSRSLFWCSLKLLNLTESKIGNSKELAAAQAAFAFWNASRGNFKTSDSYFETALAQEDRDDAATAKFFQAWSTAKYWQGKVREGFDQLNRSLDLYRKIGDLWGESKTLEALGLGAILLGNHERAILFYSQALRISQKIADTLGICSSQTYLTYCYALQGDFDKAEDHAKKALALSQKKECVFYQALSHLHFGILEMERQQYSEALLHLEKALLLVRSAHLAASFFSPLYTSLVESRMEEFKNLEHLTPEQQNQKKGELQAAARNLIQGKNLAPVEEGARWRILGKYYALNQKFDAAEASFKKSVAANERLGCRFELAKAYYDYSRFFEGLFSANDYLKKSGVLFEEVGATAYTKKISALSTSSIKASKHSRHDSDRHMSVVLNTSRDLSSILELDELLQKIMDSAIQLVGAERGLLLLYSDDGDLELRVLRNIDKDDMEKGQNQFSRSIIKKVEKEKKPLLIEDATHDSELKTNLSVVKEQIKSVICVPIVMRRDTLGVLYVENRLVSGAFNREDLHALSLIANQAGVSIENAKLYQRAITDGMTGLYNRVFFEEYLYKNLQLAQRYHKKLSVMIFDVDKFKLINDQYGHPAGDLVIQGVSRILKERLRQSDIAARFGGDEFAVILPETSVEQAASVCENLRKFVSEQSFNYQGQMIKITLSIGVCEYAEGQTRVQLIEEADKALYAAKQAGRNQVKSAPVTLPRPAATPTAA